MHLFLRQTGPILAITLLLGGISCASSGAQAANAYSQNKSLPANYKTIFENADVLVMRVHYGPHEFVPMHDHSAYPTVFVYLNDSGVVEIDHAPPNTFSVKRLPTHTGAFRIAPGMIERHSITNLSNLPSDFLRVELKTIPPTDLKQVFRGEVPSSLFPGTHNEFQDAALRIDRIVCPPSTGCSPTTVAARSLLVAITPFELQTSEGKRLLRPGDVTWSRRADARDQPHLSPGTQALRISLLYSE